VALSRGSLAFFKFKLQFVCFNSLIRYYDKFESCAFHFHPCIAVKQEETDLKCARERIELEMADSFFSFLILSVAEPCPCTLMLLALLMLFFGIVLGTWQQCKQQMLRDLFFYILHFIDLLE
jgi:hypothetical protein